MRMLRLFFIACFSGAAVLSAVAQEQPVVLKASTVFDGRGNVLRDVSIVVQHGKIVSVGKTASNAKAATYDLTRLTVLPAWIDTHVHIDWHFGPNGKMGDKSETPEQAALAIESNAWKTLQAGFTTVQALASPEDKALRDELEKHLNTLKD